MRVLVYGAGIQGSYLANVLVSGGNDVTVLARGQRAEEIKREGIVVRHYFQRKTTVDKVKVISELAAGDIYDVIFVTMKYSDFPSVLQCLSENKSTNIVMVGNNAKAPDMLAYINEHRTAPKNVVFGFQLTGGMKDNHRMVCIRGGGRMVVNGLDGRLPFKALLEDAFRNAHYKLDYEAQMDAWLKSHMVPVMPMNAAVYMNDNNPKIVAGDKALLKQVIEAINEGFDVLEATGIPIVPIGQATFFRKHKLLAYWVLKLYHALPVSNLINGSFGEIMALSSAFNELRQGVNIPTPNLDALEKRAASKFQKEQGAQNTNKKS